MNEFLFYYLILINIIATVLMMADKLKAKYGLWRISENIFLSIALVGGSAGIYLGVKLFRHKTKKFKFNVIVPILVLIQIILIGRFLK